MKEVIAVGNTPLVARLVLLLMLGVATRAVAAPCAIEGDPDLVTTLHTLLGERACVPAHVERRGDAIAVARDDGAFAVRVVSDPQTAATVIEAWGSRDVIAPLLATHAVEPAGRTAIAVAAPPPPARERGAQLFAAVQTAVASDGTRWLGPEVGGCIMLGPLCAAARVRFAKVVGGPGPWESELDRGGTELLVGGDIPLAWGRITVAPGFGGGIGMIRTHVDGPGVHMHSDTGGLRADAHLTLSYPLGHGFAADASAAIDVTQATHVESNTTRPFPDEPWLLARFALGLRYETR